MDKTENEMLNNVYIVTGGILSEDILNDLNKGNHTVIGVDRGSKWLIDHNIIPDYFIGDFDSVDKTFLEKIKDNYPSKIHKSPPEKDETDTELAMRLAISKDPKEITIFGGIGSRLDHVIANIHVLLQAEKKNINAYISGSKNKVQLLLPGREKRIKKDKFPYVSLIPFSEKVEGVNGKGFKYPLHNRTMEIGIPFGISNELVENYGVISIKKGILLIIESND